MFYFYVGFIIKKILTTSQQIENYGQTKRTAIDRSTRFFMTFAETSKFGFCYLFNCLFHLFIILKKQSYKNALRFQKEILKDLTPAPSPTEREVFVRSIFYIYILNNEDFFLFDE